MSVELQWPCEGQTVIVRRKRVMAPGTAAVFFGSGYFLSRLTASAQRLPDLGCKMPN